jgi:hypothetical protein
MRSKKFMLDANLGYLAGLIVVFLFALDIRSGYSAEDSFLFDSAGFRIHYVGNGGNCNGCEWIAIDGNIPAEAGNYLQEFVNKNNFQGIHLDIDFNSLGGSLLGAIRLGRIIRKLGMNTSVGKTIPDGQWYRTEKGVCYSACAYAFLGGVRRLAETGEYGVHQFYTDALLQNPDGKVFTPIDFSIQQATTGLILNYVMEMGASAELVIEANKTSPDHMNLLSKQQLVDMKVSFDPEHYGPWRVEAHRNGLVAFSRSQDEKRQMTIYCLVSHRAELLLTYTNTDPETLNFLKTTFGQIQKFALLKRDVVRATVKLEIAGATVQLRVPLASDDLDALEKDSDPYGSFSVHQDEPRSHYGAVYENLNLDGLAANVRLARRNCVN